MITTEIPMPCTGCAKKKKEWKLLTKSLENLKNQVAAQERKNIVLQIELESGNSANVKETVTPSIQKKPISAEPKKATVKPDNEIESTTRKGTAIDGKAPSSRLKRKCKYSNLNDLYFRI